MICVLGSHQNLTETDCKPPRSDPSSCSPGNGIVHTIVKIIRPILNNGIQDGYVLPAATHKIRSFERLEHLNVVFFASDGYASGLHKIHLTGSCIDTNNIQKWIFRAYVKIPIVYAKYKIRYNSNIT